MSTTDEEEQVRWEVKGDEFFRTARKSTKKAELRLDVQKPEFFLFCFLFYHRNMQLKINRGTELVKRN